MGPGGWDCSSSYTASVLPVSTALRSEAKDSFPGFCHLVLELRFRAVVGDGERAGAQKGGGPWLDSIPGLTITGSIIRPGYEENALIEPAQALHLGQLWTVRSPYQHHAVTRAQQSRGLQ